MTNNGPERLPLLFWLCGWDYQLYVQYICCAIAGVYVIVSVCQIYIKMNTGEDGITKSIMTLVGACLFLIGAFYVFPVFFGYRI